MKAAPTPVNEQARLAALSEYRVLDTEAETNFDAITRIAAYLCDAPIALISLVDRHRQWFKAVCGLKDVRETSRDIAFCSHAILSRELMEVEDAARDARFHDNPLVTGEPKIRFYAGMPLVNPQGHELGTLCVIDRRPKRLTESQRSALKQLSELVVRLFESRKTEFKAERLDASLARVKCARRVLADCNDAQARATTESELLQEVCRILVESGGYRQAWVGMPMDDAARSIAVAAAAGYGDDRPLAAHASQASDGRYQGAMRQVIATGEPCVTQNLLTDLKLVDQRQHALERGYRSSATLPLSVAGHCIGAVGIYAMEPDAFDTEEVELLKTLAQDISYGIASLRERAAREQAEAALQRLVRARRVMAECNRVLVHATDEAGMLEEMCRIVVESGGYVQAYIGFAQDDEQKSVLPAASAGFEEGYLEREKRSWASGGRHRGVMGGVIASGQAYISRDIFTDPDLSRYVERARQRGYQSLISLPLKIEGRCIGGISIYAREPDAFDGEEISLLTTLADDIAFCIAVLRTRIARQQAEKAARENEQRFRDTFEQAAVGITRVDLNGVLVEFNQKFCDMLGYAREELLGKHIRDITHPGDYGQGAQYRAQVIHGEAKSASGEKRFIRKDGSIMWARRTMSAACDDAGNPQYVISVVEDITERKELERRFQLTFDHAAVGMTQSGLDGRLLLVNKKYADILGYTQEELLGMTTEDVTHPDDRAEIGPLRKQLLSGEIESATSEKRLVRKDGQAIWVLRAVSLARGALGEPLNFIAAVEDITERKELERRYRETFDQAAIGIAHTSLDGKYIRINRKFCEMVGYSEEELIGQSPDLITHPDDLEKARYNRSLLLEGKVDTQVGEKRYIRKDGKVIWVRRTASMALNELGNPMYAIRVIEDITDRKELERRFEQTFNQAAVGMAQASLDGRFQQVNQKFADMLGYSREELIGMSTASIVHPDERFGIGQQRERLLRGEIESATAELRLVRKDGIVVWAYRMLSLVRNASGESLYVIGVYNDITERKRTEQELRKQVALAQLLESLARAANESATPEEAMQICLARICEHGGWALGRLGIYAPGETQYFPEHSLWHAQDLQRFEGFMRASLDPRYFAPSGKLISAVLRDKKPVWLADLTAASGFGRMPIAKAHGLRAAFAFPVVVRDEVAAFLEFFAENVREPDPMLLEAVPSVGSQLARLIERKRAMVALQEGEEQLRAMFNQASVGMHLTSVDGCFLQVNGKYCDIVGYTPEELLKMHVSDVNYPDHKSDAANLRKRVIAGEINAFSIEKRLLRKDGSSVWTTITASAVRGPDGALRHFISVVQDVSERKQAEEALRISEETFRATFKQASVGIAVTTTDMRYLQVNDKYCDILGYPRDELLALSVKDVQKPGGVEESVESRHKLISGELTYSFREKQLMRKDGSPVWVALSTSLVRDGNGAPKHFITVAEDISERKQAEEALKESEEQFRQLAGNIPQVFWITDVAQKNTLYVSPAAETLIGRPLEEVRANPRVLIRAIHEEDRTRVYTARKTAMAGSYDETFRIVRPDGSIRWVHDRAFPVHDAEGRVYRIAGIAEDVTDRKFAEERLMQLAHYDVLTSLPNRVLFYDRLRQVLAQARRNQWTVGVMFIDIDRFKNVNDTLGHAVGDKLLQQVSERLTQSVRSGDTVGRLGGDEFAIVLSDLATAQDANLVAQKIMASFHEPFKLEGAEVYVTASIGITLYPNDSTEQDTLIKNADAAMYRAKAVGRNSYQFYTPEMNARALEILSMESSLRHALDRNEFLLYYQPKASIADGGVVGIEALMRWQHPERGLVSPLEFMPVLEETGLIVPVGEWVLKTVCAQIKAWERAGARTMPVAVNLSARQFSAQDLGPTIQRILEEYQVDPALIELEITESSIMTNPEEAAHTLEYLEKLGVSLSIDDFGTGYSSLGYLKRFPLGSLKIDHSFVRDLTTDVDDATITRAVISMAHSLGLKVIAEGVETESQLAFLAEYGCDEIQGYYFSRPMAAEECGAWLKEGRRLQRAALVADSSAPVVLLVDDDDNALMLVKRALAKDGYRILTAQSAHEALTLLRDHHVDVVISDQHMPGIPGVEFLQRVKTLFPKTVRMMTSGYTDFLTMTEAVNKGEIFRFLPKNLSEEALRADVREALRARAEAAANNGRFVAPGTVGK